MRKFKIKDLILIFCQGNHIYLYVQDSDLDSYISIRIRIRIIAKNGGLVICCCKGTRPTYFWKACAHVDLGRGGEAVGGSLGRWRGPLRGGGPFSPSGRRRGRGPTVQPEKKAMPVSIKGQIMTDLVWETSDQAFWDLLTERLLTELDFEPWKTTGTDLDSWALLSDRLLCLVGEEEEEEMVAKGVRPLPRPLTSTGWS